MRRGRSEQLGYQVCFMGSWQCTLIRERSEILMRRRKTWWINDRYIAHSLTRNHTATFCWDDLDVEKSAGSLNKRSGGADPAETISRPCLWGKNESTEWIFKCQIFRCRQNPGKNGHVVTFMSGKDVDVSAVAVVVGICAYSGILTFDWSMVSVWVINKNESVLKYALILFCRTWDKVFGRLLCMFWSLSAGWRNRKAWGYRLPEPVNFCFRISLSSSQIICQILSGLIR